MPLRYMLAVDYPYATFRVPLAGNTDARFEVVSRQTYGVATRQRSQICMCELPLAPLTSGTHATELLHLTLPFEQLNFGFRLLAFAY